jgi:hypothetical protein
LKLEIIVAVGNIHLTQDTPRVGQNPVQPIPEGEGGGKEQGESEKTIGRRRGDGSKRVEKGKRLKERGDVKKEGGKWSARNFFILPRPN